MAADPPPPDAGSFRECAGRFPETAEARGTRPERLGSPRGGVDSFAELARGGDGANAIRDTARAAPVVAAPAPGSARP